MRCLLLYMSDHELMAHDQLVLHKMATWVAQVYLPMLFLIKLRHCIADGPSHLLTLFRLWIQQEEDVKAAVEPYLRSET